jgi:hypothetical protein
MLGEKLPTEMLCSCSREVNAAPVHFNMLALVNFTQKKLPGQLEDAIDIFVRLTKIRHAILSILRLASCELN